ncbi:MAG: hypothetical protein H6Q74_659 [Firmicutes bacterium]|nr:hypothetical protein [Bacillota bacterium]
MRHSRENNAEIWERRLIILLISCLVLLVAAQALMLKDSLRYYLSRVDRLEGNSVLTDQPQYASGKIGDEGSFPATMLDVFRRHKNVTLRIVQPQTAKNVYITVNGKLSGDFSRGEVVVSVYNGDYVEIDARRLNEMGRFVINAPKSEFMFPDDGRILEGRSELIPVGKVRLKE